MDIKALFEKLPFRKLAEKIPAGTRGKIPLLETVIPFANYIASGIVVVLVVVVIAAASGSGGSSGGGGKANSASDFSYDLTADGQGILIKGYTGGPGKVVVPAKIEGFPVVEIGHGAFDGKSLTFSFDLLSGTSDTGVKENDKAGILSITIPNTVRKIGYNAFSNTAITRFDMPDSVTEIENSIFSGCKLLTEIKLSDNLEHLPELGSIFSSSLPALKKANLPKNLKRLSEAFWHCGELSELVIPGTLQSVEFGKYQSSVYRDMKSLPEDLWTKSGEQYPYPIETIAFDQFNGCGKLPIKTRQTIQGWGYKGGF